MNKYVRPLAEITTLATQRAQAVAWVNLQREDKSFPIQVFASDITQQPYQAAAPELEDLISNQSAALIRLGPDGANLPGLLDGWSQLRTTYSTFFDYLTVALRTTMSWRSRFLALIPALEGLHLAKYGDGPISRRDYVKQRKAVVSRLAQADSVDQDDVKFINDWLSYYGSYPLVNRLHEIRDKELGTGLRERIQDRVVPLPPHLEGLVQNATDIWAVMGTARNRIAHGADGQPSPAQLVSLTRLAHTVAVGAALQQLGVPEAVLCEAIDHDRWTML